MTRILGTKKCLGNNKWEESFGPIKSGHCDATETPPPSHDENICRFELAEVACQYRIIPFAFATLGGHMSSSNSIVLPQVMILFNGFFLLLLYLIGSASKSIRLLQLVYRITPQIKPRSTSWPK